MVGTACRRCSAHCGMSHGRRRQTPLAEITSTATSVRAHYCGKGKPSEDSCCILHAETPTTPLHAVDLAAEGPPPSLPCPDARSVCGSAVSLPACLPRSLFAFVRARALAICPELLACCARSDCTAPCRGAGTPLLAAEAHTSATTADLSTPPPHPSPPLCSRQESSRHTGSSQRGSRVSGGEGGKPLSLSQRFTGGVTKRPKDIPRLCCRRNLPSGDL